MKQACNNKHNVTMSTKTI